MTSDNRLGGRAVVALLANLESSTPRKGVSKPVSDDLVRLRERVEVPIAVSKRR